MTSARLKALYDELVEFQDEFTNHQAYGRESPVLLDRTERDTISSAKRIVHNLFMYTEYPESYVVQHRFAEAKTGRRL